MTRPMAQELGPGLTLRGDFLGIHSPYGINMNKQCMYWLSTDVSRIDMIVLSMFVHN